MKAVVLAIILMASNGPSEQLTLSIEGVPIHPFLYVTPEEVLCAHERIESDPESIGWFEALEESVRPWLARDEYWPGMVMPESGDCFAYGFSGCPICGAGWGLWGEKGCSFDEPNCVQCSNGHLLPDETHPDFGTGYLGEDERVHYFVGSYNSWVVETLTNGIAVPCADYYLLTEDERAGRMAAVVLDELARIYPACDKGPWDYPSEELSGRLNRPLHLAARSLVLYADVYDRVYANSALEEPSSVPGLTRRENIESNLLLNGGRYCLEMSEKTFGLFNSQADYLRGILSVGLVLGVSEFVEYALDGPCGIRTMLANNVDRDGQYFETAPLYGTAARNIYLSFAETLLASPFPGHPYGLNLYGDRKFQSLFSLPVSSLSCLGLLPPLGDSRPLVRRNPFPYEPVNLADYRFSEVLATRSEEVRVASLFARRLGYLSQYEKSAERVRKNSQRWRVFHGTEVWEGEKRELPEEDRRRIDGSRVFGQKGVAVLRVGKGSTTHGAVLRYGSSLVYGHLDDLNVNYAARGYMLDYDLGCTSDSTHTRVGWSKQTVSHNTVVVDEVSQGRTTTGGALLHFLGLPGWAVAEASSSAYAQQGVSDYRRLLALTDRYALDIFRVKGGRRHDLPMHSMSTEAEFDGIEFGPVRKGSLAGRDYSWGNMIQATGNVRGHQNRPYWNPPPGNGYGFLTELQEGVATENWTASWFLDDASDTRFSMTALKDDRTSIVTAIGPGVEPQYPSARYVVQRNEGENLSSRFVSVWQATCGREEPPVRGIERFGPDSGNDADSGIGLHVRLTNGDEDFWFLNPSNRHRVDCGTGEPDFHFDGAIGWARLRDGELMEVVMLDAAEMEICGWTVRMLPYRTEALVASQPGDSNVIEVDRDIGLLGGGQGLPLFINGPGQSHSSAYSIHRLTGKGIIVEQTTTLLGVGRVDEIVDDHRIATSVPHEYARTASDGSPSGFFEGKLLQNERCSESALIHSVTMEDSRMIIDVDSTAGFERGDSFSYRDIQVGDTVSIHHYAHLVFHGDECSIESNVPVFVDKPAKGRQ